MLILPLKPASHKPVKTRACKQAGHWILILGALLVCAPAAFAQDETQYENVNVNGRVLNGFQVFALERATGLDIPNGNYWYEMETGQWGHVGGPQEGFLNLPEDFKQYIAGPKENATEPIPGFARVTSYSSCADDCWY